MIALMREASWGLRSLMVISSIEYLILISLPLVPVLVFQALAVGRRHLLDHR